MKTFKIREDLFVEEFGRKLFRIEAVVDIESQNVKRGDIGGYVETEDNLSGDAWVTDDARVYGNAQVYGDEIKEENDLINITSNAGAYNITITPKHIKIGCQYHSKIAWFNFSDSEIEKMDGVKAVKWWRTWKPILQTICERIENERRI